MVRLKSASEAGPCARSQYVGSAEGEDLQVNFGAVMDPYTQARCLGGQRYLADKIRDALDMQRGQQDRVDYLSYANFQDHDFTGASR